MNRWTVAALLLGLVLGYLVGAIGTEPKPARAVPVGDARVASDPVPMTSGDPARVHAPASDVAPQGLAVVVPDPSDVAEDVDPKQGTLVVDFTGFDGPAYARVEASDIEGNLDYMEGVDENRIFSVDLYPGEVTVRWETWGAMRRFAARARIEAARVTRILAADVRHTPLAEPPGLAILDVRVADADGRWLAGADVLLGGAAFDDVRWVSVQTDGEGFGRFRVRAGSYEIRAGSRSDTLELRAGERRLLELRHDRHGAVIVEPRLEGRYSLETRDRLESMVCWETDAVRFLFVPEGSYNLWYQFSSMDFVEPPTMSGQPGTALPDSRVLATFDVRPGRTERIAHHPEPGFLELQVVAGASGGERRWEARVSGKDSARVTYGLVPSDAGLRARVGPLALGRYDVEIVADGEVLASRRAIVAYGPTRLAVDLGR